MGAMHAITNAYATLRTTAGLKRMWVIAIVADLLMVLLCFDPLRQSLVGNQPRGQLPWLLGGIGFLLGKAYLEYAAHRLISELPVVPIADVEVLSHLNLLAKIWTVCFLTLSTIMVLNVAAGAMVLISLVAGLIFGVFAWLLFHISYLQFIQTLMSPFLGFFKAEGRLLAALHVSTEAALAVGGLLFLGLFMAPAVLALIVFFRRGKVRAASAGQP